MHLSTTALLSLLVAVSTAVPAENWPRAEIPKGKKIQWVGHSFHWFLPKPVAQLAAEAGIKGHADVGIDRIGASLPCQHWNKGGETNAVKEALKAGKADVLTLATREPAPDECIPKFVNLANQHRKDMQVLVHETWLPQAADKAEGCEDWGCKTRDAATYDMLEATRTQKEQPYRKRLREQLNGLNKDAGRNLTVLVPVWDAVISLREMVVKGQVPGVPKQTSLFRDNLGHAQQPLADMASYMWFAALYNINPIGMKALAQTTPKGQAAVLQKLAWDTLKKEPLNGIGQ